MSAEAHPGCASNEPTSIAIGHREQIHFRKKLGLQGGGAEKLGFQQILYHYTVVWYNP